MKQTLVSILESLKRFGEERKHKKGAEQKTEEKEWKELWESFGYDLLLHACFSGSVEAVQILFDIVHHCDLHL